MEPRGWAKACRREAQQPNAGGGSAKGHGQQGAAEAVLPTAGAREPPQQERGLSVVRACSVEWGGARGAGGLRGTRDGWALCLLLACESALGRCQHTHTHLAHAGLAMRAPFRYVASTLVCSAGLQWHERLSQTAVGCGCSGCAETACHSQTLPSAVRGCMAHTRANVTEH